MPIHEEHRTLPYSAEEMFGLVADVASYPQFLPWTAAARIRSRKPFAGGEVMEADLVVSFKVFRERFGSRVTLWHERLVIDTEYIDGPFRHMKSQWRFTPRDDGGCDVDFSVDFEFRNAILQKLIGVVFNEAMQRIVKAFETRAEALHGRHSAIG